MFIAVLLASMTDDQIYASCELAESVLWFLFCNQRAPLMTRIRAIRIADGVQRGGSRPRFQNMPRESIRSSEEERTTPN